MSIRFRRPTAASQPLHGVKAAPSAQRNIVILGLHDAGFTVRQIERYTGISKSTVSRIVRAYAQVDAQAVLSE